MSQKEPQNTTFTHFTDREIKELNYATLRIRDGLISRASIEHYPDGKKIAGFTYFDGHIPSKEAAAQIGEVLCSLHPEVDEVWNWGEKVYPRAPRG